MAAPIKKTATITVHNTFTDALQVDAGEAMSLSVVGSAWTGTVTLQRKLDGANWRDYDAWTGDQEIDTERAAVSAEWRLGVKTGDHSGTSVALILAKQAPVR